MVDSGNCNYWKWNHGSGGATVFEEMGNWTNKINWSIRSLCWKHLGLPFRLRMNLKLLALSLLSFKICPPFSTPPLQPASFTMIHPHLPSRGSSKKLSSFLPQSFTLAVPSAPISSVSFPTRNLDLYSNIFSIRRRWPWPPYLKSKPPALTYTYTIILAFSLISITNCICVFLMIICLPD